MAHSLVRIKRSLMNTPHLIEQTSFDHLMDYINARNDGDLLDTTPEASEDHGPIYVPETKTGVMQISGPITYRTTGWEAFCGGTSYEMMKEQMEYFVSVGAKTVTMMVDSGGGEAHGMMDSANYMRQLANDNGIKIIAYVDGMSASAAYGISCIADEIVMSSDSLVGSIGVLIQLMNNSKMLEKAGLERSFITAGKDKVPFAADGSFTDEFKKGLQDQVDTLYEGFTSHVAKHRSLDVGVVKGTEANVFMSEDALKLGLVDKVMTIEEFYDYVADIAQNNIEGTGMGIKEAFKKLNSNEDAAEMAKLAELETQLKAEQLAVAELTTQLQTALAAIADVDTLKTELATFKQAAADAAQAAAEAKVASRKAALAEWLPEADVEGYMTNFGNLEEGAFAFMVGQLKANKEARIEGFRAQGSEGAEDAELTADVGQAILEKGIAAARAAYSR